MTSWDEWFMGFARHAATKSKDPSTKTGAVIVSDRKRIVSVGYNGFPRGVEDHPERYEVREVKYRFIAHAERNALDNAECSIVGATLYATHFPCVECAKSIVQRGIARVVVDTRADTGFQDRWAASCGDALMILTEGGVKITPLPGA